MRRRRSGGGGEPQAEHMRKSGSFSSVHVAQHQGGSVDRGGGAGGGAGAALAPFSQSALSAETIHASAFFRPSRLQALIMDRVSRAALRSIPAVAGWSKWVVRPAAGNLSRAAITVPTPRGAIRAAPGPDPSPLGPEIGPVGVPY